MGGINEYRDRYSSALIEDVVPFWLEHSPDVEMGGYFTCLDRQGNVFDSDKFLWLQGRQAWLFSALYNRMERRGDFLDCARLGIDFLKAHGRDDEGDWYFALDRSGAPVSSPWSIFSDCFVTMGMSQYALAAGDEEAKHIAHASYERIHERKARHERQLAAARTGRPMVEFPLPMILINLALELAWMLPAERVQRDLRAAVDELLTRFLDRERMLFYECVAPDGSHIDSFEGRRINPGHGVEAVWIILAACRELEDEKSAHLAAEAALRQLEFGWDEQYGGIFAFLDAEGGPPEQLEWDQKLWWVHLESIVTMLVCYNLTEDARYWRWFETLHDYTWQHFPDPAHGEWWGYLSREGSVVLSLKGGKWKGCFHVPRGLWMARDELEHVLSGRDDIGPRDIGRHDGE